MVKTQQIAMSDASCEKMDVKEIRIIQKKFREVVFFWMEGKSAPGTELSQTVPRPKGSGKEASQAQTADK